MNPTPIPNQNNIPSAPPPPRATSKGGLSITSIVAVVLIAIITTIITCFLAYTNYSDRRQQMEALQKNLNVTIEQASEALYLPIWNVDDPQTNKILDSLMNDIELDAVTLEIHSGNAKNSNARILGRRRDPSGKPREINTIVAPKTSVILDSRPVLGPNDEPLATLTIHETKRYMDQRLQESFIRNLIFMILLDILLVGIIYGLLYLIVLRPLKSIEQFALAVSSGEQSPRVPGDFRGEFNSVKLSLENMVALLSARYVELKKQETMLSAVLNAVPQGIFWKDKSGTYLGGNANFARSAGIPNTAAIAGKTDFDLPWRREDAIRYRADDEGVIATGVAKRNIVEPLLDSAGNQLWVETTKVPLLDPSQKPYAVLGVFDDITDRKKNSEAIAAERDFNALILNSTPAFYVAVNPQGNIISMNHTACAALGYQESEVVGKNYLELCVPREEHEYVRSVFTSLTNRQQSTFNDNHILTKTGDQLLCQWHGTPIVRDGKLDFYIGMGIDITERDKAEKALLRQATFDAMAREILSGLVASAEPDLDAHIRESLQRMAQFASAHVAYVGDFDFDSRKWTVTHFWGDPRIDASLVELRELASASAIAVQPHILTGETVSIRDLEHLPDSSADFRSRAAALGIRAALHVPLLQSDGRVHGCIGLMSKNLDPNWSADEVQRINNLCSAFATTFNRIKAERALRDSEKRFRFLIERAPVAISLSRHGLYEYRNPANLRIYGLSPEDANKHDPIIERIAPESRAEAIQIIARHDSPDAPQKSFEVKGLRGDGTTFPLSFVVAQVELPDGVVNISFASDLSDRKRTEALYLESEKLRSVAGLAAGVAHEINNPLAAMVQNAQVCINRLSDNVPANRAVAERLNIPFDALLSYINQREILESLEAIRVSGRQASRIVQNLLSYSRRDSASTAVSLPRLIDQTLELAASDYELKRPDALGSVELIREDSPISAVCNASQIQQVIINLIRNSIQAIRDNPQSGGGANKKLRLRTFQKENFACISVEDSGPGMPESIRARIFEPFVTTKTTGTGLGLFVCYHIVTVNHAGRITVDSAPGKGTTCTIMLPMGKIEP